MRSRRHLAPVLAVVSLALVVWATVAFARTTDSDAVGRSRTVVRLPGPPAVPSPPTASCRTGHGASSTYSLLLSGSCHGSLPGRLTCVSGDESLGGSLVAPLADRRRLTLTVVVPDLDGAGDYDGVGIYAQVANPAGAQRWTNREATVSVSETDVITVPDTVLGVEQGTGTRGDLRLSGALTCRAGAVG